MSDDYNDLIKKEKQSALRQSLYAVGNTQPDTEAKLQSLAARTGLTVDAVRQRQPEVELHDRLNSFDYTRTVQEAPKLSNWMNKPQNASVAHDDMEGLTAIEKAIRKLGGAAKDVAKYAVSAPGAMGGGLAGEATTALGQVAMGGTAGVGAGLFDLAGVANDVIGKPLQALGQPDEYNPFIKMGTDARAQAQRTRDAMKFFTPESDTNVGKGFYSGLQSLGTNLTMMPLGVATGSGAVVAGVMGAITGAQAYTTARLKGMEPIGAATYAAPAAVFEYAFEKVPASRLLADLAKGSSILKTFTNQIVPEVLGEQATTVLQDFNEWVRLNPAKTLREFAEERPDAAVQTLVATLVGVAGQSSVVGAVGRLSGARQKAEQAESVADTIKELQTQVAGSKLKTRNPQAFRDLVGELSQEGDAPKDLYVSSDQLLNTLNQSGITMEQLAMVSPTVASQLQADSFVPGSDIRVPVAEFLEADSSITGPLVDYMRESPDAMNRLEAAEYISKFGEKIGAEVADEVGRQSTAKVAEDRTSVARDYVQAQLDSVGKFRPETNKAYAGLMGSFYGAQSERAGMTPVEMLAKYGIGVAKKTPTGRQALDQADAIDEATGLPLNSDGTVTVYHHTSKESANKIKASGRLKSKGEPDVYVTTRRETDTGYGDTVVAVNVDPASLIMDDEFPDGRIDYRLDTGRPGGSIAVKIRGQDSTSTLNQSTPQTETVEFKNWFGDSKVVDAEGKPLVVYHGGNKGITVFESSQKRAAEFLTVEARSKTIDATFFTKDKRVADSYRKRIDDRSYSFNDPTGAMYETYVSIKNPFVIDMGGKKYNPGDVEGQMQKAKSAGHDGMIVKNIVDDYNQKGKPTDIYVTFSPEQIKSATGNRGTFDPSSPNILNQSAQYGGLADILKEQELSRRISQQSAMNEQRKTQLPAGHRLIDVGTQSLQRLQSELDDVSSKLVGLKKWFGASKVVDDNGAPKVVYHGTSKDVSSFRRKPGGRAIWAADTATANSYAGETSGSNVIPVLMAMENPLVLDANGSTWQELTFEGERLGADDFAGIAEERGHDGVIIKNLRDHDTDDGGDKPADHYAVFKPEQIKSAIGNNGSFDPSNPNILEQDARATLSFASDITTAPSVIALLEGANKSSFIHEAGHFFLEVQADLSSRIEARILAGDEVSSGERGIVNDMNTVLDWFGIQASPEYTAIQEWSMRNIEERRDKHETFARGFEKYSMEGTGPTLELQSIFSQFRDWLLNVYKQLKSLNVELTDEVRGVFDRMLASDQAIQETADARGMGPLYESPDQSGMTPEEFDAYQALGRKSTSQAETELDSRLLKDMKWLSRARSKAMKEAQAEADEVRREVEREVRAEVMVRPVYQAWQILRGKGFNDDDVFKGEKAKGRATTLDPAEDNLFEAIAKLGGLNREAIKSQWGVEDRLESGVFGKPVLRNEGGASIDSMAEYLVENGYLLPDTDGKADIAKFEELFDDQRRGVDRFSLSKEYSNSQEEAPTEGVDLTNRYAKLNTDELKRRYGTKDDAVWRKLSERRMTNDTGIDPDVMADSIPGGGFDSGDQLVRALAEALPPAQVIADLTDARMMEQFGDITSQAALNEAADVAVHNELRARVIATELKALEKAGKAKESGNSLYGRSSVNVIAKAAKEYAARAISRQKIKDLRPKQYAAAEARSARLTRESMGGDLNVSAKHKQNQLINNYATKLAYEAQAEVRKGVEFFRKVTTGATDKVSKSRDFDMVMAARAVLAEYGIGTKGEVANSYLASMESNDPDGYKLMRDRVDNLSDGAKPINELTVEEFRGLKDEIQSLWDMARRNRQIVVDGKLMDIEDAETELQTRMEEIGIPLSIPGEKGAITVRESAGRALQHALSLLRRVEQWAEGMDGEYGGPFLRLVFLPVKQAADRYRADKVVFRKKYQDLVDAVAPSFTKLLIEAPSLGYTFGQGHNGIGHAELLHAILHTGNASNKRKLLLGRGWATLNDDGSMNTDVWDLFIKRMHDEGILTKVHYDFAQGVWNLLEETKPLAQKTHREVFGRYFDEVTADGFDTPFGRYSGGYVPAQGDPRIVQDAEKRSLVEAQNENMAFSFPSTNKGFTKGRTEYNVPLMLDLRTIGQHLDKVLLFSHMESPARDANRLLSRAGVSRSLGRIDPTIYSGMLTPWLQRSARQIVETPIVGDGGISRVLSVVRARAGMSLMMGNVSNTLQQLTGFVGAFGKLKSDKLESNMIRATAQFMASPKKMSQAVSDASIFMEGRMGNEIAAINNTINEILLNPSLYEKGQAWTQKHAYFLQSAMANTMEPIIWTAAYNAKISKSGDEKSAVEYADSVIRQTQGSTLPEDVSRMETGPAYARFFTQFVGYFNMIANTNLTALRQLSQDAGVKNKGSKALFIVTMGMLVPMWVAEAIAQAMRGGPEDDEGDGYLDDWLFAVFGMGTIKGSFAMIPFVGQTVNAGINRFNGNPADDRMSMSPVISLLEAGVGVPVDVYKGITDPDKLNKRNAVRDVASAIGLATGLPAVPLSKPLGYLAGVMDDRITPENPVDQVRGMLTGAASPVSKN